MESLLQGLAPFVAVLRPPQASTHDLQLRRFTFVARQHGLVAHGMPHDAAARVAHLPPVANLFAAFLGYNPVQNLLGPHTLHALTPAQQRALTGRGFFPHLLSSPFHTALTYAFVFAIAACVVAAFASLLRGGRYHWNESEGTISCVPYEEAA